MTAERAAKIKGAIDARIPHKQIAKVAGVSVYTVRKIAYRERWAEVAPDQSLAELLEAWMNGGNILPIILSGTE